MCCVDEDASAEMARNRTRCLSGHNLTHIIMLLVWETQFPARWLASQSLVLWPCGARPIQPQTSLSRNRWTRGRNDGIRTTPKLWSDSLVGSIKADTACCWLDFSRFGLVEQCTESGWYSFYHVLFHLKGFVCSFMKFLYQGSRGRNGHILEEHLAQQCELWNDFQRTIQ